MFAHHGTVVIYDQTKKITLKGTVTDFVFKNPHVQIGFDVKDKNGKAVHWLAEGTSIYDWSKAGWRKDSLKAGDQITITLLPSKSGAPAGEVQKLVTADGKLMTAATATDSSVPLK